MRVHIDRFDIGRNGGAMVMARVLADDVPPSGIPYHYVFGVGIRLRPLDAPDVHRWTPSMALALPEMPGAAVVFDFLLEEPGKYEAWPPDEELRPMVANELLERYRTQFRRPGV